MSRLLGEAVRRGWPLLLAGWVLLVLGTWWAAPPWDEVAQDREFAFLPPTAPSRGAEDVFSRAFPDDRLASNIVLVLSREAGEKPYLKTDLDFIDGVLAPGIRDIAAQEGGLAYETKPSDEPLFSDEPPPGPPEQRSLIARIRTPFTPGAGSLLVSPDEQALLVVVELTTDFLSHRNWPTIERVENLVARLRQEGKVPQGLEVAVTGSAVIGRDRSQAQLRSVRATGVLTVVLVIVLLVLIYRAPLLALIPLLTVYLSVQVAMHVLAILGNSGYLTVFQGLQIYITILAYGAGVDYCLFLTARYKEELDRGLAPAEAVGRAVSDVSGALVASAATVMCGIAMMVFAQFGKFREAGYAIPLSLLLVLCATLTFSPALLRLAGRWAFWPQHDPGAAASRGPLARLFAAGGLERIWDRVGRLLLRRGGAVWLATVAVMAPFAVVAGLNYNLVSYDVFGDLPADAPSVTGTRMLQRHFPAGLVGTSSLLIVNPHVDFASDEGRALVGRLTDRLRDERDRLDLADVRSLTQPLGITEAAAHDYSGVKASAEVRREEVRREALKHYVSGGSEGGNHVTRLDLVLGRSPFSVASMDALGRIEQAAGDAVPAAARPDTEMYAVGATASVRDLAVVVRHDRTRIELLVLASVFVILVVFLRGLVVPVYLLLSVLFSYYTTLGVAFGVFWLLDPAGFAGIDWKVAIFLFTILIAVGEDYNIFLMTRVREEQGRHGPVLGVTAALDRTGPIISSCGIIMAGTFASLLAGSLAEMKQLGFALAFGVLLDTFVVRPILVPAFLILWQRWRSGQNLPATKGPAT
jgi:RND superfamily putative drug exporter